MITMRARSPPPIYILTSLWDGLQKSFSDYGSLITYDSFVLVPRCPRPA